MLRQPWKIVLGLLIPAMSVSAGGNGFSIQSQASVWWILHEQVENGLVQNGTLEPATDEASGFNLKAGRLAFVWNGLDGRLKSVIQLRLEERADILDAYGSYTVKSWFTISAGQMRIPSTREAMSPFYKLDFISKSTFAKHVSDYALSRTPYISSVMSVKSYDRDTGIALSGALSRLSWRFMVSNGIGAGCYIGGREDTGFIYTNRFGDYYYGARVELLLFNSLTLGLHASQNSHQNVALSDRGPVLDFDRSVWTADLQAALRWGQRIYAFFGQGNMNDCSLSLNYLFEYEGWGISLFQPLMAEKLEFGGRMDRFETNYKTGSIATIQNNWTFGLKYCPEKQWHVFLNYILKETQSEWPDLNDDILFVDLRFLFSSSP